MIKFQESVNSLRESGVSKLDIITTRRHGSPVLLIFVQDAAFFFLIVTATHAVGAAMSVRQEQLHGLHFQPFHLDHAAALTYIMEKTNFKDGNGKVYMTHPTKALHRFMMQDFARMGSSTSESLFTPVDVEKSIASIIPISVHQDINVCPGVSFTAFHAGHVLGACMFLIEIAGLKVLYTGDYSREEDRHLVKAELPPVRPDVLIVESTFGVHSLEGREEKEGRFTGLVHSIIRRDGHVLLPTFALGRAQELLLILDDYWAKHPELHNVPIYYASGLAKRCMAVYRSFIPSMNSEVQRRFAKRDNPFVFKHISNVSHVQGWEKKIAEGPPCVVLASPGFMQAGASRALFKRWAPDARNGLIITGYSIEGTMARDIMNEPDEITSLKGDTIPRKMTVDAFAFSAHVDYAQNAEFIEAVNAEHVVLVHGEKTNMSRLRDAMELRFEEQGKDVKMYAPRNLETLELLCDLKEERIAKAIGTLASKPPQIDDILSGLLIANAPDRKLYTLLDPRDLACFTGLSMSTLTQRQRMTIGVGWELVKWHLEGMFGKVEEYLDGEGVSALKVMGVLDVKQTKEHELTLEWESSASNDMIADSTIALITGIDKSPASVKLTNRAHHHGRDSDNEDHCDAHQVHPHAEQDTNEASIESRIRPLMLFLESHFGAIELHVSREGGADMQIIDELQEGEDKGPWLNVGLDDSVARIDLHSLNVSSDDSFLKERVQAVLNMAYATVNSLSQLYALKTVQESVENWAA
ncbi:hypothetical protein H1R20_g11855, partial [Candolleomyces eurysporus]